MAYFSDFYKKNRLFCLQAIGLFVLLLCAKGAVLLGGLASDDYSNNLRDPASLIPFTNTQARFLMAPLLWFFQSIGVDLADTYIFFGFISLFLSGIFVLSALRFLKLDSVKGAMLVAIFMATHPYLAEIFTFKSALPHYALSLLFSIIAFEALNSYWINLKKIIIASLAILAMLWLYQSFLTYFLVVCSVGLLISLLKGTEASDLLKSQDELIIKLRLLISSILIAFILFWVGNKIFTLFGFVGELSGRAKLISSAQISERFFLVISTLRQLFWGVDPIYPSWIKQVCSILFLSGLLYLLVQAFKQKLNVFSYIFIFVLISTLLLLPILILIPFGDWWPAPRVVAPISWVVGLVLLISWQKISAVLYRGLTILFSVILFAFILKNNQIMSDQLRVNRWDQNMANKIMTQWMQAPNFKEVTHFYIHGVRYSVSPKPVSSLYMDLNISAFGAAWSQNAIFSETTGLYLHTLENQEEKETIKTRCSTTTPWPANESVFIDKHIAVVCL